MDERPAPRWCVAVIRWMQSDHEGDMAMALVVAATLFATMAIRLLAAHWAGRL